MTALSVILALVALAAVAWLLTVGVSWIIRGAGRATGLDAKVDQFLEVDGDGLSRSDRLKFQEQLPRGGGLWAGRLGWPRASVKPATSVRDDAAPSGV